MHILLKKLTEDMDYNNITIILLLALNSAYLPLALQ